MRFANPQALWWSVVAVFGFIWWVWVEARAIKRFKQEFSLNVSREIFKGYSKKRRRFKVILLCMSLVFFSLAAARPQMGTREESVRSVGLDIVFALDVSNSMLTEDVVPSRIKKARHLIKNFLDKLYGDRVGIVAFAGSAYPIMPLTTDYDYIKENLDIIDTKTIQNQGTNISKALNVATGLLDRGGVNEASEEGKEQASFGSRVIIVLSDGEDNYEGASLAKSLKEKGILIYTIGVGSLKGGPIPIRDEYGSLKYYKKDAKGAMVLSKLESKALESLASDNGGKYYMASMAEDEVGDILKDVNSLERAEGDGRKIVVYEEYFQYPLAFGLLIFLSFLWFHEAKQRKKKTATKERALLGVVIFIVSIQAASAGGLKEFTENKAGIESFSEKNYPEAIRRFGTAQAENPDEPLHSFNLGTALALSKSNANAVAELKKGMDHTDANLAAKSAYNLGRALEDEKNLDGAIDAYQKGLDRLQESPKADDEIRSRLKRALVQAEQQKNQKQDQKEKKDDKNKEDQKQDPEKKNSENDEQDKEDKKDEEKESEKNKPKQYRNPKPQFKPDQLSEEDAKRILKQLSEQEKKTGERLMKSKLNKDKPEKDGKDW